MHLKTRSLRSHLTRYVIPRGRSELSCGDGKTGGGRLLVFGADKPQGVCDEMVGRPPIGDRAMTGAERMERYRQRHAAKLARKAARRGHQGPPTEQDLRDAIPTWADIEAWFPQR